jgi:hypothetical protein
LCNYAQKLSNQAHKEVLEATYIGFLPLWREIVEDGKEKIFKGISGQFIRGYKQLTKDA